MEVDRIEEAPEIKIVGQRIFTALAFNEAEFLWSKFMPSKKDIQNVVSDKMYSIQKFPMGLNWANFNPNTLFEKWAGVEVSTFENIPFGMLELEISAGKYAVFTHKGTLADFEKFSEYIFTNWLPNSKFVFDDRPQFEIMGDKYLGHENPESEEEVWIPIKLK